MTMIYQYNYHGAGIILRLFYLDHAVDNVRTSQETLYVSATSSTV
jgi:hypothetical protein